MYYGRETKLTDHEDLGQTARVCGHSPLLATELQKVGITVTGTNCKGIPTAVKRGQEPVGTVHAFRSDNGTGDILVLTWTDKRKIVMLSTKHKVGMVLVKIRYKPYMHKCYKYIHNQQMLGVDKLDQFASYYSFLHKSVKCGCRKFLTSWRRGKNGLTVVSVVTEHQEVNGT